MEEMTLRTQTEELFKKIDKLATEAFAKTGISIENIADLDDDTVIIIKRYFSLMKKAEEMALAQAEQLDKISDIDWKLDKVLAKLNSKKD